MGANTELYLSSLGRDPLKHAEYAAANAGVVGLTRAVASELYPYGITCNAFSPFAKTWVSFELTAYNWAVEKENSVFLGDREYPFELTPNPDDIGPFLTYLSSDAAAKVGGSVFSVSGSSIGIFAELEVKRNITKYGGPWTMEELMQ